MPEQCQYGLFPLEKTRKEENHLLNSFWPQGDLQYLMSGRCGIYHCLLDIQQKDRRKVAYLPLYTCETVVAPYVKAGYSLCFYPLDREMRPLFEDKMLDKISLISICGYYGFSGYDREFVARCHARGITVIEDMTHSVLSADGLDANCDYAAGSLRKWMGVACGGFALKKNGKFSCRPCPPHEEHLKLRYDAIRQDSTELFWKGEMLLRQIFDDYGSDDISRYIMDHADIPEIRSLRRRNYRLLLDQLKENPGYSPVFPILDENTVPSHFTVLARNRDHFRSYLNEHHVKNNVYWVKGPYIDLTGHPETAYLYEHVVSIFCDQRFTPDDIACIARVLNQYQGSN